MAIERPSTLDARLDSFIAAPNRAAVGGSLDSRLDMALRAPQKAPTKDPGAIYSTGGAYDQFGPTVRAFNPFEGFKNRSKMEMVQDFVMPISPFVRSVKRQPGSALPFVGQMAGNVAGAAAAAPSLNPAIIGASAIAGGTTGAGVGEGVRQLIGRKFGVQPKGQIMRQLGGAMIPAAASEILGAGAGMALNAAKPAATNAAIRLSQNIIRPMGRLKNRGAQIAESALQEGVLRSGAKETQQAAQSKINSLMQQVDQIASGLKNQTITAEGAGRRMDALSVWYRRRGDPASAEKILTLKNNIMKGEGLTEPVMQTVLTPLKQPENGFVIPAGSESKLTTPTVQNVPLAAKTKSGILKSVQAGEVPSAQNLENADDVILQQRPNKQVRLVAPKRETSIVKNDIRSPAVEGPATPSQIQVGTDYKELPVKKALEIRRNQDALLKTKKVGGGYHADTNSSEVLGRQEFTGAMRREIGKASPEIAKTNKRISSLIDIANAAKGRDSVSSRNNPIGLVDAMWIMEAVKNPKAIPFIFGKKAFQSGQSGIAKGLYRFGKGAPASNSIERSLEFVSNKKLSPARRALLTQIIKSSNE